MADREKVIKGLEICIPLAEGEDCPKECPYYQDVCPGYSQVMLDALALLKEQRAVKPEWSCGKAYCGACGKRLPLKRWKHKPVCPSCGKAVNWDD